MIILILMITIIIIIMAPITGALASATCEGRLQAPLDGGDVVGRRAVLHEQLPPAGAARRGPAPIGGGGRLQAPLARGACKRPLMAAPGPALSDNNDNKTALIVILIMILILIIILIITLVLPVAIMQPPAPGGRGRRGAQWELAPTVPPPPAATRRRNLRNGFREQEG